MANTSNFVGWGLQLFLPQSTAATTTMTTIVIITIKCLSYPPHLLRCHFSKPRFLFSAL